MTIGNPNPGKSVVINTLQGQFPDTEIVLLKSKAFSSPQTPISNFDWIISNIQLGN